MTNQPVLHRVDVKDNPSAKKQCDYKKKEACFTPAACKYDAPGKCPAQEQYRKK